MTRCLMFHIQENFYRFGKYEKIQSKLYFCKVSLIKSNSHKTHLKIKLSCESPQILNTENPPVLSLKYRHTAMSLHGDHPHRHSDVREPLLLLHVQDGEASLQDNALHDVQMTDQAAVYRVQSAALPCHIILYNDDPVGSQALLCSPQEFQQIFICQVTWP